MTKVAASKFKWILYLSLYNLKKSEKLLQSAYFSILRLTFNGKESKPQNPEFKNNLENFHPCN